MQLGASSSVEEVAAIVSVALDGECAGDLADEVFGDGDGHVHDFFAAGVNASRSAGARFIMS